MKIEKTKKEIKYPCLMESEYGDILLCTDINRGGANYKGTILYQSAGRDDKVGNYSECWMVSSFKPYTGTITLSND